VNLSEEFLNYNTKNAGHYSTTEGSTVYHNILSIKKSGLLLERDYGYEPSWFEKGFPCGDYKADGIGTPKKCYSHNSPDENALKKVISTNGINFKSLKKNTNEIIKFLAREQRPLTISLTVNFNGWLNSGETFYNEDLRAECLAKPSDCGGHSVALTGYDMEKKVFFFKNSWGSKWGSKGFGTVTFDTVDRYVVDDLNYALVSELELPEDFKDDKLNLASFDFVSSFDQDNSYKIKVTGEVNQAQGRPLYISSFVVTKFKDDTRPINDMNVSVVNISETSSPQYLKTLNYLGHGSSNSLVWNAENPLVLSLDSSTMQSEKVQEIINDTEVEALLRTTIYVHTDDQGYKTLKRIYRSL
jgi:hypothetical protein